MTLVCGYIKINPQTKVYGTQKLKDVKIRILFIAILAILVLGAKTDDNTPITVLDQDDRAAQIWVDSVFNSLNEAERLGQLFMIRAHSDKGSDYEARVENQIKKYHVGGLCFFQGTPERQAELTNRYQRAANIPLMISMDAEWGLGMRFPKTGFSFPKQLTLGAIQDNRLLYEMGVEVARQLSLIHI